MSGSSDNNNSSNDGNPSGFSKGFSFVPISDFSKRLAAPADDDDEDDRMDDSDSVGWYPSNRTEEEIANVVHKRRKYKLSVRSRHHATERIGGLNGIMTSVWNKITFPLERPESCTIRPTKGLILHGPKGVGKTMLMEALAERCSDYNPKITSFVGNLSFALSNQVENDLVQLFNRAKQQRPSVIFLDNFHRLAAFRGPYVRTLRVLLDELDDGGSVFVIAATQCLDKVDPEIRKEGRLKSEIPIGFPDLEARKDILYKLSTNWFMHASVIDIIANETADFNGSDLWHLWFGAYNIARTRANFKRLELDDFKEALRTIQSTKQPQGIAGNADK